MKIRTILLLLYILTFLPDKIFAIDSNGEFEEMLQKIRDAEKAEQLYTVRYNLSSKTDLSSFTIEDQRNLLNTHAELAKAFKSFNHFRNAADVYAEYLELLEAFHKNYLIFLDDSLRAAHQAEVTTLAEKKSQLMEETSSLEKQQEMVESMRKNYLATGGSAALLIIIIVLVVVTRKNKSIRTMDRQILENQAATDELFRSVVNVSLVEGTIGFVRFTAGENCRILEEMTAFYNKTADQAQDSIKLLTQAGDKFDAIRKS